MAYEINVSKLDNDGKTYRHFFATHERSLSCKAQLQEVYNVLKNAFPEPMYNISISYNPQMHYGVNTETFEHKM
jgi:hypothetical protein